MLEPGVRSCLALVQISYSVFCDIFLEMVYQLCITSIKPICKCRRNRVCTVCLFFFFGQATDIQKFLVQRQNLSCSCNLHHSCSNTRSFLTVPGLGSNPHCLRDNTESLTCCATAGTPKFTFFLNYFYLLSSEKEKVKGLY